MRQRFVLITTAVLVLLMTNMPTRVVPGIKLPGLPPEVAFAVAPQSPTVGELPDRRTRFSKTSRNSTGTFTTTISALPMNYRD
jgi:hypothetical protein